MRIWIESLAFEELTNKNFPSTGTLTESELSTGATILVLLEFETKQELERQKRLY